MNQTPIQSALPGDIICAVFTSSGSVYLGRIKEGSIGAVSFYICVEGEQYKGTEGFGGSLQSVNFVWYLPTPEQVAHFEACERAGKYVDPPIVNQIINNYELF
jgi:hypothetical protein